MEPQTASGQNNRIKVAWICHFTDDEIQSKLPLWKKSAPFGAWIKNTLEGFQNSEEFEIHVLAPHQYLKRNFSFEENGIFFHFFKIGIPVINRSWPSCFELDILTNFYFNRKEIKQIIKKINPSLINLQGAENAYYSSSILELYQDYPTLVSIQGFVSFESNNPSRIIKKRVEIEEKIIKSLKYFGGEPDSRNVIGNFDNKNFSYFNYYYPNNSRISILSQRIKSIRYELLFWGRITKDKGAEDFLVLVANLKLKFPKIKACVIGPVASQYLEFLIKRAEELGCNENILFKGFINSETELYEEVLKSKLLILPTYNDRFPTVLREATCLKIGVVAYSTGSIPHFNAEGERILLSEIGDISGLIKNTLKLLEDEEYFNDLVQLAYLHGKNEFSVESNSEKLINAYKTIINLEKSQ